MMSNIEKANRIIENCRNMILNGGVDPRDFIYITTHLYCASLASLMSYLDKSCHVKFLEENFKIVATSIKELLDSDKDDGNK